jgi:hypothetical protein
VSLVGAWCRRRLQPILAGFATIVDAELFHRGYTRHTVTPTTWDRE